MRGSLGNEFLNLGLLSIELQYFSHLHYSRGDHYPFYQLHRAQIFFRIDLPRVHPEDGIQDSSRLLGILEHVLWSLNASNCYGFDELLTPLASPSEGRVLATRSQTGVGFATL